MHSPGVDALNPIYDSVFHVLITAEMMAKGDGAVVLNLMNGETMLGTTAVTHASLVDSPDKTITERRKMGSQGSSLEFRVYLCGMLLPKGSPSKPAPGPTTTITSFAPAASQKVVYVSSQAPVASGIGTVRVTAVKGRGFNIQKKRLKRDDIPDVYCKIMFGSSPKVWRTATIPNNTTPAWNESSDFLLSDHGQIISIEAYDEDKGSRDADDRLGSARIAVGKLLLAGGIMDVELQQAGTPTGEFITLRCDLVNA
jgi:hypothetical protein